MLKAYALDFKRNSDKLAKLIEFSYNNNYHNSIGIASFEALYGKKYRLPLYWDEVGEKLFIGAKLVQ